MKPLKVVIFSPAFDTGGWGWRLKRAFDRYRPDFSVRSIHSQETYFNYPYDHRATSSSKITAKLFAEADIIHMRNGVEQLARYRLPEHGPFGLIVQHHGTRFREDHLRVWLHSHGVGATQLASTVDLTILEPDVGWLPSPFDLSELQLLRLNNYEQLHLQRSFRVAHSPTSRKVKSTDVVMAAVGSLYYDEGIKVTLDLIERKSYEEALHRKARADLFVDQLKLGFGNSAIEAMAMGIPVIAGVEDPLVKDAMIKQWGFLPFYESTEATLKDDIRKFLLDARLRDYYSNLGLHYVQEYHDERYVSDVLAGYYRSSVAALEVA